MLYPAKDLQKLSCASRNGALSTGPKYLVKKSSKDVYPSSFRRKMLIETVSGIASITPPFGKMAMMSYGRSHTQGAAKAEHENEEEEKEEEEMDVVFVLLLLLFPSEVCGMCSKSLMSVITCAAHCSCRKSSLLFNITGTNAQPGR